jgi:hypothetical protein
MFGKGLNCVKLLSPNKRFIEPTPYAAYPTRNSPAIRPRASTGVVSSPGGVGGRAQFAAPVVGRSGSVGAAGSNVIGVPLRHRPAGERSGRAGHCVHGQSRLNLPTTRDLIGRLRVDEALRTFCGWRRSPCRTCTTCATARPTPGSDGVRINAPYSGIDRGPTPTGSIACGHGSPGSAPPAIPPPAAGSTPPDAAPLARAPDSSVGTGPLRPPRLLSRVPRLAYRTPINIGSNF